MAETLDWPSCRARVAEFLGMEPVEITREIHIYDELGIDSLGMFSLGMHLIGCFGVKLPMSEVASIKTIGDLYDALHRNQAAPTAEP